MTRFLAAWGSRTSAWRAGRDRHVEQVPALRALQSKFQGCLTPDEAAYHRNASQGRLWGGLLGRGSGLWPANTASAAVRVVHHARERETDAVRVVLDQYGHGRADRSVSGGVQGPESGENGADVHILARRPRKRRHGRVQTDRRVRPRREALRDMYEPVWVQRFTPNIRARGAARPRPGEIAASTCPGPCWGRNRGCGSG